MRLPSYVQPLGAAGAVGLAGVVLAAAGPRPALLAELLRAPQGTVSTQGADTVAISLAGVLGWVVLGWLTFGLLLVAASRLPGACGQAAARAAEVALPGALHRAVALALGLSLVPGVGAASAATGIVHPAAPRAAATLNLDWPATAAKPAAAAPSTAPRTVVVHRGDTLWAIAARSLGPGADDAAVAAEWPRWYAANRAVIGADPDLIKPGQILDAPTARRTR